MSIAARTSGRERRWKTRLVECAGRQTLSLLERWKVCGKFIVVGEFVGVSLSTNIRVCVDATKAEFMIYDDLSPRFLCDVRSRFYG